MEWQRGKDTILYLVIDRGADRDRQTESNRER